MRLQLVTPPVGAPVTLQQAKQHCRVDSDDDDALIQQAVDAAVSWLDGQRGVLRRCIVNQRWRADVSRLGTLVALPFPDVTDITGVFSDDAAGSVEFEQDDCRLRIRAGLGRPASFTFTAGFGSPAQVPPAIARAVLLLTGYFYDTRNGGGDRIGIPREVDDLISPFRLLRV